MQETAAPVDDCAPGASAAPWYVAHTKPRQEQVAAENLLRQAYRTYLPRLKVLRNHGQRQHAAYEPLFPRYLFLQPKDAGHSVAPVRSTIGISSIVCFGGVPAVLRSDVITGIRSFEFRQNVADVSELCPLHTGSKVIVACGALAGLAGVVRMVSRDRVLVLMHLLGEETKVMLGRSELKLVA